MARKPSNKSIIAALNATGGNISATALKIGCNRDSIYEWFKKYPELKKARDSAFDSLIDMAESKLFSAVKNGELTAIIFALKTQGRHRGYIERTELTNPDGSLLPITSIEVVHSKYEDKTDESTES